VGRAGQRAQRGAGGRGERPVILLPWWLHHLTACPWHLMLLRQRCGGCDAPLWLAAGRGDCGDCGAAIAAMPTRSIAEDADEVEVSALLWRATGCVEGASPSEGLPRAGEHALRRLGTPALLTGLWGGAQALVAGDGGRGCTRGRVRTCMRRWWRRGGGCATDRDGCCCGCRGAPTAVPPRRRQGLRSLVTVLGRQ